MGSRLVSGLVPNDRTLYYYFVVLCMGCPHFKLGTKSEDDVFHNEVFVCRLGKEVVTMTVTQSITTKDGVVWYVVDVKGQKTYLR